MRKLRAFAIRLAGLIRPSRSDSSLAEELECHLQMATEDGVRSGLSPPEARRQALLQLGGFEAVKENCRDRRGLPWLDALVRDVRLSLRTFRRNPGFTATVVLTLALGIGATTAIFTVVNGVMLRPLPYPEPDRLVYISSHLTSELVGTLVFTRDYEEWKENSRTLSALAGYTRFQANSAGRDGAERLYCGAATSTLLPLLGVRPAMGRAFLPEEDRPGGPRVAMLEYGFWQRRFGGARAALGSTVTLNDRDYTIVGVLPPGFRLPNRSGTNFPYDLWIPLILSDTGRASDNGRAGSAALQAIGRLSRGASIASARDELTRLERLDLPHSVKFVTDVQPWHDQIAGRARGSLRLFTGAVGFVLLIVCVNVANLLLCRSAARHQEMAVRRALGAGRARLLRQLLTESLLIALMGGAAGLILAYWCKDVLLILIAPNLPAIDPIGFDQRVIFFNFGIALVTGFVFGLAPAWQGSNVRLNESLKEASRGATEGRTRRRTRNVLAISEVALAMVLLSGAGLLLRSFLTLRDIDMGFQPEGTLMFSFSLTAQRYPQSLDQARFLEQVLERLDRVPGVQQVAGGSSLPLSGYGSGFRELGIEGRPGVGIEAASSEVNGSYFRTMGIPLIAGRAFDAADREGAPGVAIVSQSLARRYFHGESPLGRRIMDPNRRSAWLTIVGVVGDIRLEPSMEPLPTIYLSYLQPPRFSRTTWPGSVRPISVILRTAGNPMGVVPAVRSVLAGIDPTQPPHGFATLNELRMQTIAQRRVNTLLITAFAVLALVLGSIGIYGVLAYSVGQRTHEIGVRIALGADRRQVLAMVLWKGVKLIAAGIVIGLAASLAIARVIASALWGVSTADSITFAVVILVIALSGLAACSIPARRATAIDPVAALRHE